MEPGWGSFFLLEVTGGGQVRLNGRASPEGGEWGWMVGSSSRATVVQLLLESGVDASVDG